MAASAAVKQALAMDDSEDTIDALADVIWRKVDTDWDDLSQAESTVFGVWCLKVEVVNGGLAQFLFNSVGGATPQIIEGLERIGATRIASIVRAAIAVLGPEVPLSDWRLRQSRVSALQTSELNRLKVLSDELEDLLPDAMQRARSFASAHADDFSDATI